MGLFRKRREKPRVSLPALCLGGAVNLAILVLNAVIMLFLIELVAKPNGALDRILRLAYDYTAIYWSTIGALTLMSLFFVVVCGTLSRGLALGNGFMLLFGLVNYFKQTFKGEVFLVSDFMQAREAFNIAGQFELTVPRSAIAALLVASLCIPLLCAGRRTFRKGWLRAALGVIIVAFFTLYSCQFNHDLYGRYKLFFQSHEWYYNHLCFVTGYFHSYQPNAEKPKEYSQALVEALLSEADAQSVPEAEVACPDILFLMLESFYDESSLVGDRLSADPIAEFKALEEAYFGGNRFISPVYGGTTANAEYEVLTGYSMEGSSIVAYTGSSKIREGMESVVSILKRNGYYTQAAHPNIPDFFVRQKVYRQLGFDRTDFSDTLPKPETMVNDLPTDEYFFRQIRSLYEQRPADQPWFCHAVTYQNHAAYDYVSPWTDIEVSGGDAEDDARLRAYTNGLCETSRQLGSLLAYFEKQERPVLVVVWGDHSPNQARFGIEDDMEDRSPLQTTPLLIWSNYGLTIENAPAYLPAYRLGAYALQLAGVETDAYMRYLASDAAPNLFPLKGYLVQDGKIAHDNEEYETQMEKLRMLRYDRYNAQNYGGDMP